MKLKRTLLALLFATLTVAIASAQTPGTWTATNLFPSTSLVQPSNPLLLSDGSIILHDAQGVGLSDWYKLTPDINGSYLNGTLTQIASLPPVYNPLYFSSEILNDGRLLIEGGEDTFNNS